MQNKGHHHRPSGDVSKREMNFLADVSVGRAGARIRARHFAVADGGEQHSYHVDQNRGDNVPASSVADNAINAHRGDRLNDYDADDDEVPKVQSAFECEGRGRACVVAHSVVTDFTRFLGWSTSQPFSVAK